ncbi:ABC transporter ATP-binding protein [Trinickia mobilis]|uniref:ABC transporter ATP-binding protein n=1 Tax=Trinickia mobilis TaxID=2816356 RepID=UPI001A8C1680|nr:ABC transporter ATP-binding protein [Trinickia mobilis]
MIREWLWAGQRLSGIRDSRLTRGLGFAVIEGGLSAAPYPLLYVLLERVFEGTARAPFIAAIAAALVVCLIGRIAAGCCAMPLVFSGAYAMMAEARIRIAEHLQRLPMGWFTRTRSGELAARLTSDLELVEHLWSHFLGVCASGLAMLGFLLLFLGWLDARLALTVLAVLPLAGLAMAWGQQLANREGEAMLRAAGDAQAELHDYVHGIAVIRGYGRFGAALSRLARALDAQRDAMVRLELKPAPWIGAFGFVIETGFVLMVLAGTYRVAGGSLRADTLALFAALSLPVYRQLQEIGFATLLLRFGRRAMNRIQALLDEAALAEPVAPRQPADHDIVLDDVHFAYGENEPPVLHGVSCTLPARAITAVVGPSGAGKSTLVHLIARLWDVQRGAIRIGGADVREIGTDALQARVATVFQDVVLFSGTVLDNLRIGRPEATRDEVIEAARRACAHDFIERLPQGYETPLGAGGGALSGGERQRLSIARALLKNAPILLLDEATASVDPSAEADIQEALSALVRDRTVVVIAHRLQSIAHADQIVVLDAGRLVEAGRHDSLLAANGLYARLWRRQTRSREWRLAAHGAGPVLAQDTPG